MRQTSYLRSLVFASRKLRLGIQPSDLVLEVGGGHNPHFRSDVLCDKFLQSSLHRQGRIAAPAPLVQGDIEHLPFRDKVFDFVIASHILEHVDKPDQACRELARVGKRGYIETPHEFQERLIGGNPAHKWLVIDRNGQLIFRQKPSGYLDEALAAQIWQLQVEKNVGLADFWSKNSARLYVMHRWAEQIECEVIREDDGYLGLQEADDVADTERDENLARPNLALIKGLLRLLFARPPIGQVTLDALLACPVCVGPLTRDDSALTCPACECQYPITNGIPRLLLANEAAQSLTRSRLTVSAFSNTEASY
jgi:uncharacterized protein YbaR (Trm112 family)